MKYKILFMNCFIYDVFIDDEGLDHYTNYFHKGDIYTLNTARTILKLLSKNKKDLCKKEHSIRVYLHD